MRSFFEESVRGSQIIRRWRLLNDILDEFSKRLPLGLVMPHADVIALSEPFRTMLEDPPITSNVTLRLSQGRRLDLLQRVQSWNETKTALLLEMLQQHRPTATRDDLYLCTTLFRCSRCPKAVYHYPAILSHRCCKRTKIDWRERMRNASPSQEAQDLFVDRIELHIEAVAIAEGFTRALGRSFLVLSSAMVLMLNPLVQCVECSKESGGKVFMRWSAAVNYVVCSTAHSPSFTKLT